MLLDGGAEGDKDSLPYMLCDLRFESRKELGEHKIKKHKGERVHPCIVCDEAFKSLPMFSQHKSRRHRGHVFVCEGCD